MDVSNLRGSYLKSGSNDLRGSTLKKEESKNR